MSRSWKLRFFSCLLSIAAGCSSGVKHAADAGSSLSGNSPMASGGANGHESGGAAASFAPPASQAGAGAGSAMDSGLASTRDAGQGAALPDASASLDPDAIDAIDDGGGSAQAGMHWVTSWGTALIDLGVLSTLATFDDVTLRQIVHTSVGGRRVRIRFSNAFGMSPITIGAAHVALRQAGSAIVLASDRTLTFSGASSVVIPAGVKLESDPIAFDVPALTDLAISIDLPELTVAETAHSTAIQNNYVADQNGVAGAAEISVAQTLNSWAFLEALSVETTRETSAIVAFGDSITDGWQATNDASQRWPDELARRLAAAGKPRAVVNEGFSGNQVLGDFSGDAATTRFERDVLGNAAVTHVIVLEGINDIGISAATSDALIAGYQQLIAKAHGAGLKIIFGTIVPFEGAAYYSDGGEATRKAVNQWIRTSHEFDAMIDFEAAVRDPSSPGKLLPAYDSGDALHPSDAGYKAMGEAIDLSLFD